MTSLDKRGLAILIAVVSYVVALFTDSLFALCLTVAGMITDFWIQWRE